MPRIKADPLCKAKDLARVLKIKKIELDLRDEDIAREIGISERSFARRKRSGNWEFPELIKLFRELHLRDEDILKIMK
ncbi:toxin-antitoxin system, antitoxin component, Xre domain protein [Oribacterium sp. oral taxon 078 str. F0263]|uniref:hypothetical protein n=1 Tax=Oribacterium sp. oral taxon 078 TaxID=652706 RepID=UPI0003AE1943|nr:hypothetical protein [Oribacterium sp. oral taxon 078]ERL22711.1 toxin-antitoxin system, antitoxin component, Xre domain protein [Oribacterium sp. oral taxon 078 str. F0263]